MSWLAGALAASAVWLCWPVPASGRLGDPPVARAVVRRSRTPLLVLVAVGAAVVGALADGVRGAVVGWVAGSVIAVFGWVGLRARDGRRRAAIGDQVARGCGELAALLRGGRDPLGALRTGAGDAPLFAEAAAQQRVGGDLVTVLREASRRPGAEGFAALATGWRVAERTGAAMTTTLDDLAASLVAERELRRTVATELAAARLTGRLLGLLPAVGLVLGYAVGGDPRGDLTGSPPGLACLALGGSLAAAGVVWSESLAERAGRLS